MKWLTVWLLVKVLLIAGAGVLSILVLYWENRERKKRSDDEWKKLKAWVKWSILATSAAVVVSVWSEISNAIEQQERDDLDASRHASEIEKLKFIEHSTNIQNLPIDDVMAYVEYTYVPLARNDCDAKDLHQVLSDPAVTQGSNFARTLSSYDHAAYTYPASNFRLRMDISFVQGRFSFNNDSGHTDLGYVLMRDTLTPPLFRYKDGNLLCDVTYKCFLTSRSDHVTDFTKVDGTSLRIEAHSLLSSCDYTLRITGCSIGIGRNNQFLKLRTNKSTTEDTRQLSVFISEKLEPVQKYLQTGY